MKRERMLEFLRELGLDTSKTVEVYMDPQGWWAAQFLLDADGKKVLPAGSNEHVRDKPVSGDWE